MKIIQDKILYSIFGVTLGLVIMICIVVAKQNKTEATSALINYQSGCLLSYQRISEKNVLNDFDYRKMCVQESMNIYDTYLDISDQMDLIMGYK